MTILNFKKKEENFIFLIKEDSDIAIKESLRFYYLSEQYKILEVKKLGMNSLNKEYECLCKLIPNNTIHDYRNIDFFNVYKIERKDSHTISIKMNTVETIVDFNSAKECLHDFIQLQRMQREVMSSEEYYIKR